MDKRGNIVFLEKPKLRNPHMVFGISGWVDGGEAATGSIEYLVAKLKAKRFAEIPIEKFHVFQVPGQPSLRPEVKIEDGILKEHRFPQNSFFYWANPDADNDLVLFSGTEPNLNWAEYANSILSIVEELAVTRIYLLGGVLDKTPHSKEPGVSCTCSSQELKEEMKKYSVNFSSYEGPGSFSTTLIHFCQNQQVQTVSMMVRTTYYPEFNVVVPRNPRAITALVRRLNDLLHLKLGVSDLEEQAKEIDAQMGAMVSRNPEFQSYVEELEKSFVEVKYEEPLDISADEAVRLAEELLEREQKD